MKVYIIYDEYDLIEIFSSKKKAEKFKEEYIKLNNVLDKEDIIIDIQEVK